MPLPPNIPPIPRSILSHKFRFRRGAALDFVVLLVALLTFCFWIAGSIFLAFFPAVVDTPTIEKQPPNASSKQEKEDSEETSVAFGEQTKNDHTLPPSVPSKPANTVDLADQNERKELESAFAKRLADAEIQLKNNFEDEQKKLSDKIDALQSERDANFKTAEKQRVLLDQQAKAILELNQQIAAFKNVESDQPQTDLEGARTITPPLFRLWEGSNGRKVEMAYVRWDADLIVFVDKSNRIFSLPLSRFSSDDQRLVETFRNQ